MRRKHLAALMSVSVAALISAATSSQATQREQLVLGVLKPSDSWKVGTVDVRGASFCAMVNKYNSGVGLAFARSPEGYGSVALDLRENVFKFNKTYEVTLKTDKTGPRTLPGKATSERSMVLQIGDDKALYDAFRRNGTLQLVSENIDISLSLSKFSNSYKSLVTCADKLNGASGATAMPAVKVKEVEQQALSPIDREIEQLSGKNDIAAAEAASSLDEQLEVAASADVAEFKARVATLDKKHAELTGEIATRRDEAAVIEEKKEKVERKLLASVKPSDTAALPAAASLTAQELEKREIATASQQQAAAETAAKAQAAAAAASKAEAEAAKLAAAQKAELDQKQAQLAALEAEKASAAERHVAEFALKEQENAKKAEQLAQQAEALKAEKALAAADNKALKANLVSKEAQLVTVNASRDAQVSELTKKLAATQGDYQSKIAALQSERDSLAQRLGDTEAKVVRLTQVSAEAKTYTQSLEAKLMKSETERQGLEVRLATLEKTAASLTAKQQEGFKISAADAQHLAAVTAELAALKMSSVQDASKYQQQLADKTAQYNDLQQDYALLQQKGGQLASVKAELDALKASSAQDSAKYKQELADKAAQYNDLQADYAVLQQKRSQLAENGSSLSREHSELTTQLSQKQAQVAELEAKLKSLEQERIASAAKAEAAIKDLAAARREAVGARKSLVIVEGGEVAELAGKAAADRAALDKAQAEIAQLRAEKTGIEQKLVAKGDQAAQLTSAQQAELDAARAESEILRKANSELSERLAAAASQTETKAEKAGVVAANVELEKLRQSNIELQQRLAQRPVATPVTDAERAELVQNRSRVKELELQLADTRKAVVTTPAPVVDARAIAEKNAQLLKAEAEITRLRTAKTSLEYKLADKETRAMARRQAQPVEPAFVPVAVLAATEPGAGEVMQEMPAVPAAPVEEHRFDDNRAAAFLDRIMSYHRTPDTEKTEKPAVAEASRPVFGAAGKSVVVTNAPVKKPQAPVTAAAKPYTPPVEAFVPPVKSYPPVVAVQQPRKSLSPAAAPAYVDDATKLVDDSGMTPMPEDEFAAAPAPKPQTQRPSLMMQQSLAAAARPLSIEGILTQSGLSGVNFKSVDAGPNGSVRQWSKGDINGMYEQTPATADFGYAVQSYLDRYREDCPGQLQVSMGKARSTATGTIQQADIACPVETNTYSTSFVFTQAGSTFNAILHTGYPQQAAEVKQISDAVAAVAGQSVIEGGKQSQAPTKVKQASSLQLKVPGQPAAQAVEQKVQRRFNIREEQPAAAGDEFETVIVQ